MQQAYDGRLCLEFKRAMHQRTEGKKNNTTKYKEFTTAKVRKFSKTEAAQDLSKSQSNTMNE